MGGRCAFSPAPRSSREVLKPNAKPVSPQDWLHDWLTRACMSCLAFSGPIRPQAPQAPWQHGLQHSLVQHLPRGGLYRGGSVRTARARAALHTACRQFASHTAGCSAERVNKYTLGQCCSSLDIADFRKGRRPQPDSSENRERRGRPLRTLETVSVETIFHIIARESAATRESAETPVEQHG